MKNLTGDVQCLESNYSTFRYRSFFDSACSEECEGLLESEIHYLNEGSVEDYLKIIYNLKEIFVPGFTFKKSESVKNYLQEHNGENIILVIPERASKSQIQEY